MAVQSFDFRQAPPAEGGARNDYIAPGVHRFKVIKYDPSDSKSGKVMHAYTLEVIGGRDPEVGKRITDYFPLPDLKADPKASLFPLRRLHAFFIAAGAKNTLGKVIKIDPARFIGRQIEADVFDERQEASTAPDGRTFPARTQTRIGAYIDPNKEDEDEDEDEEDEEDENTDELDDEGDEDDEEDEDEPEPEPAPRRSRAASATATRATAAVATKPKAAAKTTAKKAAPVEDDDDDEFPFDEDDEDEEPEPAPARRRRR